MKRLKAVDICGGAGGWACAARELPIEIVWTVDLWDAACRTYRLNFPTTAVFRADVRDSRLLPAILAQFPEPVDIVLGGIPCEWLTPHRNIQIGMKGAVNAAERKRERATLSAALALVERLAPRWWCLEDVRQIVRELPPHTPYVIVDAAAFSAQRRKRAYVGVFPPPWSGRNGKMLASELRPGPFRIGKRAVDRIPVTHNTYTKETTQAAFLDRKGPTVTNQSSRRDAELVVVDEDLPGGKRQFEWQELARLQGFPKEFVFYGSPTDVAKLVGQAIQVDTGRAILKGIVREARRTGRLPKRA